MRNDLLAAIVEQSGGTVTDPSNRNTLLNDWLGAVISGGSAKEYTLLASQYDYAEPSSEVTLPHKNILSFDMFCDINDDSLSTILSGSTGSVLYFRGSDGRLRLVTDQGNIHTRTFNELFDGGVHKVLIYIGDKAVDFYIDGSLLFSSPRVSTDTITINKICEGQSASIFNLTVGAVASYPMLTYDTVSVNTNDEIGDNNLTYVNLLPLTDDSYREVSNDY